MLGDNRANSADSRYADRGPIPIDIDRRPRLRPGLAPRRHRRRCSAAAQARARRGRRPCGRRGRCRRRRCRRRAARRGCGRAGRPSRSTAPRSGGRGRSGRRSTRVWCRFTASMPAVGQRGGPLLGPVGHAPRQVESTRRTSAQRSRHARHLRPVGGGTATGARARPRRPPGPPRRRRSKAAGSLTSSDSSRSVPTVGVELGERGDVRRAGRPGRTSAIGRCAGRCRTTPSWSSTATPSRGEPHVALEARRAQPDGQARRPRACSRGRGPGPPGGRSRSGGVAARAAEWARRPIVPDGAQASWWSSRHLDTTNVHAEGPGGPGEHGNGDQGELPRLRRCRAGRATTSRCGSAPRTTRAATSSAARAARCPS